MEFARLSSAVAGPHPPPGAMPMRNHIALTSVVVGLALLATALVRYVIAREVQRQQQAVLDRAWREDVDRATRRFPPALPRARPDPPPLRGLPLILGLLAGGLVLGGGGLAALLRRPGRPRHSDQCR
jgi:hypothetical protein